VHLGVVGVLGEDVVQLGLVGGPDLGVAEGRVDGDEGTCGVVSEVQGIG
jgi:hypothetical protein